MKKIKKIKISDPNYPQLLKEIPSPPKALYVRGEIFPKENCFAVVGTRMCSPYGKEVALEMASALSEAGLTIVSGLAPGIDTYVHRAVVEKKKRTIAVLGTGLDRKSIYPKSNIELAEKILETGGALISEYPPGISGSQFTFPKRNRIISGLSLGVLIVEAKEKSGALITAKWAEKQERLVFAIPGSIRYLNSKGCHYLIKRGAKLVECVEDILEELPLKCLRLKFKKEVLGRTKEESLILEVLKEGALEIDKIIEKTKLPAQKVAAILSVLEAEKKISNLGGNIYVLFS
ncbi:DNA-processing protein DprA [bacterium]|nr:DNA-processing protein DprA [bacterium]